MFRVIAAFAAFGISLAAQASCGSAFCMVNTGWIAQGGGTGAGTRFDLRYEYIDQDQPLAGKSKVAVGEVPRHHDEVYTVNRNFVGTLDHGFDDHWGVNVSMPVVRRDHLHIHNHMGEQIPERWQFTEVGDLRVLGRYNMAVHERGEGAMDGWGVNFGAKLPTGPHDIRNQDGEPAERSLQPGSGTTDALLGAYFVRNLPLRSLSFFSQVLYQYALNERDEYRPGPRFSIDAGMRYELGERLGLMVQLNALQRGKDHGAEAEPNDTGGRFVYVSPGLSWNLTRDSQLYSFVQLPVYQKVNGVQLVADYAFVVGASMRF